MKSRPVAAAFFVVFCLLLCGLILRRQIAGHPLPPNGQQGSGGPQDYWTDQGWHAASSANAAQVRGVLQGEMAALRGGDAPKAMSYSSRSRQERFAGAGELLQMTRSYHPELASYRAFQYGPIWTDQAGQNAQALLFVRGQNGERVRENILLVREGGRFKIDHLRPQLMPMLP